MHAAIKFAAAPLALTLIAGLAACSSPEPAPTPTTASRSATPTPSTTSASAPQAKYDTSTWIVATSNGGDNPSTTLSRYSVHDSTITPLAEMQGRADYNVVSGDGKYVILDDSIETTSIGALRLGDTRSDLAPVDVLSIPGFGATSKVHDIYFRPTEPHTLQVNVQLDGAQNTMTEVGIDPTVASPTWATLKTVAGPAWEEGLNVDFMVNDGTGDGNWRVIRKGDDAISVDEDPATDSPYPWQPNQPIETMLPGDVNQGDMRHEAVNDGTVWRFQQRTDGDVVTLFVAKRRADATSWTNVGTAVRDLPGGVDWARPLG